MSTIREEITLGLARPALCVGTIIEKTRTVLEESGLTWEIDEFRGRPTLRAGSLIVRPEEPRAPAAQSS